MQPCWKSSSQPPLHKAPNDDLALSFWSTSSDDERSPSTPLSACRYLISMSTATLLHGFGSGLIGIFVAVLIRHVQIIGFGVTNPHGGFLEIILESPIWRRTLSLSVGGIFGAMSWYWLRGRDPVFVPVTESMDGGKMPVVVTIINAMIQDITVALGGSYGREAAPRELCAMWGGHLADWLNLRYEDRRLLVACGTGAGLAAVYSVPLSGFFYTIEHILDWDLTPRAVVTAVTTSLIATATSCFVVPTGGQYHLPLYSYMWPSISWILWAAFIGPIAGIVAACFGRFLVIARTFRPLGRRRVAFADAPQGHHITMLFEEEGQIERVRVKIIHKSPEWIDILRSDNMKEQQLNPITWEMLAPEAGRDWTILIAMPTAFFLLAILSGEFPSLLGNGRALARVAIAQQLDIGTLSMLFFLKMLVTLAAIASGVDGGTLTPSVALGATLGVVIGVPLSAWCSWLPPPDLMAIVSAAAFLAASMNAPITAMWLMVEFSAQGVRREDLVALLCGDPSGVLRSKFAIGILLPISIAVTGSMYAFNWWRKQQGVWLTQLMDAVRRGRPEQHSIAVPDAVTQICQTSTKASDAAPRSKLIRAETCPADLKAQLRRSETSPSVRVSRRRVSMGEAQPRPSKIQLRRNSMTHGAENDLLDLRDDYEFENLDVDDDSKAVSFTCFRAGLRLNMILTVGVAAAAPLNHNMVLKASSLGVIATALVGVMMWSRAKFLASNKSLEEPLLVRRTSVRTGILRNTKGISLALCCAIVGALLPMLPYRVKMTERGPCQGGILVLIIDVAWSVLATAYAAAIDAQRPYGDIIEPPFMKKRRQAVCRQAVGTLLSAGGASIIGFLTGQLTLWIIGSNRFFIGHCNVTAW